MGLIEYLGGQCLLEEGESIVDSNGNLLEGPMLIRTDTFKNPDALTVQGGGKKLDFEGVSDIRKVVQNLKP